MSFFKGSYFFRLWMCKDNENYWNKRRNIENNPFFMPLRQYSTLFLTFVAKHQACRNNSDKYLAFFLESAKITLSLQCQSEQTTSERQETASLTI